jgi:hypothetical protein
MLAESIIRIGKPLVQGELSNKERIRWLTDVSSENCKNYFQNVFLVELGEEKDTLFKIQVGIMEKVKNKDTFSVNPFLNASFPILYPNGGNPLHAQGIYPVPCYLMYDPHIKKMDTSNEFMSNVLLPRLNKTIHFQGWSVEKKERLANRVSTLLEQESQDIITEEKQLGILMIYDPQLSVYETMSEKSEDDTHLWITESRLYKGKHLHLNGTEALKGIISAKFEEASELGKLQDTVSTFSNQREKEVVSIYNKSWLWLSPTWEMPRSIYWGKSEWTKGIKVDKTSYEAFLYGAQFLKQIQVPITSSVLKEMFAPIESAEAKQHKKGTSYDQIFGVPLVLPLLYEDLKLRYKKYRQMLKNDKKLRPTDLHLEVLAGMKDSIVPDSPDDHRLTILYYSGDLSRGAMHIRAVIEDIIPSVAYEVQTILTKLRQKGLPHILEYFSLNKEQENYRTKTLPALLGNAYGSGYVWDSLQKTLHRQPLRTERLHASTSKRLNELANKEEHYLMKQELVFYYSFLYFLKKYEEQILHVERSVKELADWQGLVDQYHEGSLSLVELSTSESLGFATGLLLRQFSNSYHHKTGKDYVKHRVMKFGSKLTPEMIWKIGVLRCEELAAQWRMGLSTNFRPVLSQVLLGFIEAEQNKWLIAEKDRFMTAFWAGYLSYKKIEEEK